MCWCTYSTFLVPLSPWVLQCALVISSVGFSHSLHEDKPPNQSNITISQHIIWIALIQMNSTHQLRSIWLMIPMQVSDFVSLLYMATKNGWPSVAYLMIHCFVGKLMFCIFLSFWKIGLYLPSFHCVLPCLLVIYHVEHGKQYFLCITSVVHKSILVKGENLAAPYWRIQDKQRIL